MSRLSMDLKVMPRSHKGHKYMLCIIDEVTSFQRGRRGTSGTCNNQILHTTIYNNRPGQCFYVIINDLSFPKARYKN